MPGHGPDCAAPLEPARADAGWSTTAPVSSPLDGGTYDRVVPALSSAVHSMGEIDHAVPGIPSLQLLTSALEGGSGIGSRDMRTPGNPKPAFRKRSFGGNGQDISSQPLRIAVVVLSVLSGSMISMVYARKIYRIQCVPR